MATADKAALKAVIAKAERADPVTLTIVRHGATRMNAKAGVSVDRERSFSNIPLTREGREEAEEAARKLQGKGIRLVRCSDLERAVETAQIISGVLKVDYKPSRKLRPWNLGTFTGKLMKDVTPQIAEYAKSKPDVPVPEGESFNAFRSRAFEGIAQFADDDALLVTHHRVERLLAAWNKAGQPISHAIDIAEFLKTGDQPGGIITLKTHRQLLAGELSKKFTHTQVDYGRGHSPEFCRTCEYSDHMKPKPHCSYVDDIERGGWCVLWEKA